jgi:hypothetical protein
MQIKRLTKMNIEGFFSKLSPGEIFTYSDFFFPRDIVKIALQEGIRVSYCPPGSEEYKKHGCYTMKVGGVSDLDIANMLADYHKECNSAESLREKGEIQLKHARRIRKFILMTQ